MRIKREKRSTNTSYAPKHPQTVNKKGKGHKEGPDANIHGIQKGKTSLSSLRFNKEISNIFNNYLKGKIDKEKKIKKGNK